MFSIAIFIGVLTYLIFILGIASLLYPRLIVLLLIIFFSAIFMYCKYFDSELHFLVSQLVTMFKNIKTQKHAGKNLLSVIVILFFIEVFVNGIGVLGPEFSFDALWYHLTLPKLFLSMHAIKHIPGGLLYYSDMPKLGEMFYAIPLAFGNEIGAKLTHYLFGLLICLSMYLFMRQRYSRIASLISILIFYSNLVVGWESITAYIDLIRTFFEFLSFCAFINWVESKDEKWLFESAVMIGLAISTKLLSIGSLGIFFVLIFIRLYKEKTLKIINNISVLLLAILIPLPWFILSFLNTGNPIYPFFTSLYKTDLNSIFPLSRIFTDSFEILIHSPDPLVPLYVMIIPLIFITYKRFQNREKYILFYCLLSFGIWYLTPRTGGGRFILPYLPVFSILSAIVVEKIKTKTVKQLLIFSVLFCAIVFIGYRGVANIKYIPYLIGKETKGEFLARNLNFSFGDFYDTDGYFKNTVLPTDTVLLYGFHNLYYVNFPFIDASWVKKGDRFNYIAAQNTKLPDRFRYWQEIYNNSKTHVKLYSQREQIWTY